MKKSDAIRIIYQAAKIYNEQICNKKLLVIYNAPDTPRFIETIAYPSNFLHLTGVKLNENNSAETFYKNACDRKLKESDFDFKDNTSEQKLNVLIQTLRISTNAKMIGDFTNGRLKLQTDKLAGSVNSCLGFIKVNDYYIPNTVLAVDIRQETSDRQKVLAILSKKFNEEKYNTIEMVGKKIDIEPLLEKVSTLVKIESGITSDIKKNENEFSGLQQNKGDNIKQIKFNTPAPQNILHINYGSDATVLPAPNPLGDFFAKVLQGIKDLFKPKDKLLETFEVTEEAIQSKKEVTSDADKSTETSSDKVYPDKMEELNKTRNLFIDGQITLKEYSRVFGSFLSALNSREKCEEAKESLQKQLNEASENSEMCRCFNFELDNLNSYIERKFTQKPKQTLNELKQYAYNERLRLQNEKKAEEKETVKNTNYYER